MSKYLLSDFALFNDLFVNGLEDRISDVDTVHSIVCITKVSVFHVV